MGLLARVELGIMGIMEYYEQSQELSTHILV